MLISLLENRANEGTTKGLRSGARKMPQGEQGCRVVLRRVDMQVKLDSDYALVEIEYPYFRSLFLNASSPPSSIAVNSSRISVSSSVPGT